MVEDEFGSLLNYLVQTKNKTEKKVIPLPNTELPSFNTKISVQEITELNPLNTKLISNSKGFEVEKFKTAIRNHQIKKFLDKQELAKPYTSVTELLNCVRYNFYYRNKTSVDIKNNFKFIYLDLYADLGTALHEIIQTVYQFSEVKKAMFSDVYNVRGEADAISPPYLFEIKTVDENKFPGTYRKKDYYQANIYAHILNTEYNYKIKYVTLVYFFRDNLRRDPYAIDLDYNPDLAVSFLEKSNILLESLETKRAPNKMGEDPEQCHFCIYKDICKNDAKQISVMANGKKTKKDTDIVEDKLKEKQTTESTTVKIKSNFNF